MVFLVGLVGLGCSGPSPLVAEDPTLDALLREAAEAWQAAGVYPPAVATEGRITVHWGACPEPGREAIGCMTDAGELWFDPELQTTLAPLAARAVQHEMGHVLRGDGEHLPYQSAVGVQDGCFRGARGPELMCPSAGPEITAADSAFVR